MGKPVSHRKRIAMALDAVWVENGRLVSHTISEPAIKRLIEKQCAERRKDPEALKEYYVKAGMLTKSGKLTKRYGGR
mgnify:CR=1 FL=1